MASKSTTVEQDEEVTTSAPATTSSTPQASTTYHPAQARDLQRLITDLEAVIARARLSLVQNPPPAPPTTPLSTDVVHGTVATDFAEVYATPHVNAKVTGTVAQGGVLPLVADGSKDGGYIWWKIADGEFKNSYVKGRGITMQ